MLYYERKIPNFIMLLNIVRSSVLKRHSYLYMARKSEQRVDVSGKITVFLFLFLICEDYKVYYERKNGCAEDPPESILISATMAKAR